MRILLLEDNRDMVDLIIETLAEDYEVVAGYNGLDGLNLLATHPIPDAIITDLIMPRMDGVSFIRELRNNPAWAHLPCLVISGDPTDRDRALQNGANAFLVKPFRYEELSQALTALLDS